MTHQVAGIEPGQRHLNGPQTTGRTYCNLSEPAFEMVREDDVAVPTRDGTLLQADVYRPTAQGQFPVLVAASCYPRQIQDLGAPMGFIEAGASDFFVPRGYVHVIANLRGTAGSGGTFTLFDQTECQDLYDLIEWAAVQPWSDGNVGMIGISYFAMTQLEAASQHPPHLKAIFPLAVTADLYEAIWHHGLLNSTFITSWLSAVAVAAGHGAKLWRGKTLNALRKVLALPKVHQRFEYMNGEAVMTALKSVMRLHYDRHPWDDLRYAACVEHPVRDAFWDERNLLTQLDSVDIPVYLGCDWDNVPLHLPSTFTTLMALAHNPYVRVGLLGSHGLSWPWESLHIEALAWFDHWLKGSQTGIEEGPPIRYWLDGAQEWRTAEEWPPSETSLHHFALRADGALGEDEGEPGKRDYMCITDQFELTPDAHPPDLPPHLQWETDPLEAELDMAGNIELALDARLSTSDAGIITVLLDVAADGTARQITAGWLRASLRTVDEQASRPGAPVLSCREPIAVPPGEVVSDRIPIVANAHRFVAGHRIRLLVCSDDQPKTVPTMLGFRHQIVAPAVQVSICSSSRLSLPVLAARLE
ncbi:MAG: CocE/NonD family hydrolase [Ktedonobacteraceae bacterium]